MSVDESAGYLQKAATAVLEGLRVVRDKASLLITSADIERELGDKPAQLAKLREAVASDSASEIGRYLLARAYRQRGEPQKAMGVLEPIIQSNFKAVKAYIEYTKAMLEAGEPIKKCVATLALCKLDGETDPAFVGLYGGLLFMDARYAEAKALWDNAKEHRFPYDENIKRQYRPSDPDNPKARRRFTGTVQLVKPSYVLIQPEEGPVVITKTTVVSGKTIDRGNKVTFELSFSARGALAEDVRFD